MGTGGHDPFFGADDLALIQFPPAGAIGTAGGLGWAGVSVHCQVLAFLGDSGLSIRTYITGKLLHGALSALLANLLFQVIPLSSPAGFSVIYRVKASSSSVLPVNLALTVWVVQKNSSKGRKSVV